MHLNSLKQGGIKSCIRTRSIQNSPKLDILLAPIVQPAMDRVTLDDNYDSTHLQQQATTSLIDPNLTPIGRQKIPHLHVSSAKQRSMTCL
jgi:hypothetical protein